MAKSIRTVSGEARVVRAALTAEEQAEPMDFVVALGLRNVDELRARVAAGSVIPNTEMEARYLPLRSDYQRVCAWLASEGFVLTDLDSGHANIFARGSVSQIARSFEVNLARVATGEGEFTSAISAPTLPEELAALVINVDGLQPHIRLRPHSAVAQLSPVSIGSGRYLNPASIASTYGLPSDLNGSGQTISVIMSALPATADLTRFWSLAGSTQSIANVTTISIGTGPNASSQSENVTESCLDLEWAGALAPNAKLRLYAPPELTTSNVIKSMTQVLNDAANDSSLRTLSCSFALVEGAYAASSIQNYSQTILRLSAAGITILVASGDSGSNPNLDGSLGYDPANPLGVEYPSSDPNVTAVGGTGLTFNASWTQATEVAYGPTPSDESGTGGGVSTVFSRPSWQVGNGVPSGSQRCVPDVAAVFNCAQARPFLVSGGFVFTVEGTSLSTPVWAAIVALINQARLKAGLGPIGLLNHTIYSLIGTSAFNDITSGNNGAYTATVGYDLCTGVGTPSVANLISALASGVFVNGAPAATLKAGAPVSLSVSAPSGATFQWKLNGTPIPGATSANYTLAAAGAADNGSYSVTVTTSAGSTTYSAGTLQTTSDARIINLSARAFVGVDTNNLSAGFVVTGPAGAKKTMLLRGVGPTLANFGMTDSLAAPVLTFYNAASAPIDQNSAWGGGTSLAATMASAGAFALPANSLDAALVEQSAPATYTAAIVGANKTVGTALAEIYDTSYPTDGARLVNISARANVAPNGRSLVAGFAVSAEPTGTSETVVIRAVGPTLAGFGVPGALAKPILTVYDSKGAVIATNTGWGNLPITGNSTVTAGIDSASAAAMSSAGAFGLAAGSADSALVLTLPAGIYTAQVDGVSGGSGVALCEIYELR